MSNTDDVDSNFINSEREMSFILRSLLKKHIEVVAKKGGYLSSIVHHAHSMWVVVRAM